MTFVQHTSLKATTKKRVKNCYSKWVARVIAIRKLLLLTEKKLTEHFLRIPLMIWRLLKKVTFFYKNFTPYPKFYELSIIVFCTHLSQITLLYLKWKRSLHLRINSEADQILKRLRSNFRSVFYEITLLHNYMRFTYDKHYRNAYRMWRA